MSRTERSIVEWFLTHPSHFTKAQDGTRHNKWIDMALALEREIDEEDGHDYGPTTKAFRWFTDQLLNAAEEVMPEVPYPFSSLVETALSSVDWGDIADKIVCTASTPEKAGA